MARLYGDFIAGTLSVGASNGAVSSSAAIFESLPAVTGSDELRLVFDPHGIAAGPEIVRVSAHSASSTTVTHDPLSNDFDAGTEVVLGFLNSDFQVIQAAIDGKAASSHTHATSDVVLFDSSVNTLADARVAATPLNDVGAPDDAVAMAAQKLTGLAPGAGTGESVAYEQVFDDGHTHSTAGLAGVSDDTYIKGTGAGAVEEVSAAAIVAEGGGIVGQGSGRQVSYGQVNLTWTASQESVDFTITDVTNPSACILTPVANDWRPFIQAIGASSVTVRGFRDSGAFTGVRGMHYAIIHEAS